MWKDASPGALMLLRRAEAAVKQPQWKSLNVPEKMHKTSRNAPTGRKWVLFIEADLLIFIYFLVGCINELLCF